MGKPTLEIEYDYDFVLIGISSHEKDYRICWALNNKLELNLVKTEPYEIKEKKHEETSHFSFFVCEQPDEFREYLVIANRSEKGMLIPEQKQVDYFFVIKGEIEQAEIAEIIKKMKDVNLILTAFQIDISTLKSKQNLIF